MTPPAANVRSIFGRAAEIESPAERAAYLDQACAGDADARARVEALLAAHGAAGSFLQTPAAGEATADYGPLAEGPGVRVGPYKLLQEIGEGGMGVVFMAEQDEPVRRKVALKIIKPGMDSRQVVARFEAERQALSIMDHPNIARVLDAGTTDSGRPYFVMELVHGVPITEYCDANTLAPRDRLALLVPVCQAIQHAHQKGVIHRDIKPSNVLVTMYDDKPVPKVIDFGVAKAVEHRLTEKTLFTQYGAMVGTVEYMSPEQAEMNAFGVDTRSDVYSLGVLLYELLTGTTPLDRKRLREAAYGEVVRLIKEEEPPRPSVRLSTSGTRARVAAARRTEPGKLSSLLRGELDWIVMRCLEKDRALRYDGASSLAADIQRYLKGDAVEACPPTVGYRLRKLYRRNRAAVWVAAGFLLLTYAGACGIYLAYQRSVRAERAATEERARAEGREAEALAEKANAEASRKRAEAAERQAREEAAAAKAVRDFLQEDLLGQASVIRQAEVARLSGGDFAAKPNPTVHELIDRAAASLAPDRIEARFPGMSFVQAEALKAVGEAYTGIAQDAKAVGPLARAVELYRVARGPHDPATLSARHALGAALLFADRRAEGVALLEAVLADRVRVLGPHHPDTFATREEIGTAKYLAGRSAAGLEYFTRLRDDAREHLGPVHLRTLVATAYRATLFAESSRPADAVRETEALRAVVRAANLRPDHPYVQSAGYLHARALAAAGRHDEAISVLDDLPAGAIAQQWAWPMISCGWSLLGAGRPDRAVVAFEKAVAVLSPESHPQLLAHAMSGVGHAYRALGRTADEVALREKARDLVAARLAPDHLETLAALRELANAYDLAGRRAEARALLEDVIDRLRATRGPSHPQTLDACMSLCYALTGQPRAVELAAEVVAARRKLVGPDDPGLGHELSILGANLLHVGRPAEAEPPLREAVRIKTAAEPNAWRTAVVKTWLGAALLGQKKYAEAEPLLLAGHAEMAARRHLMPPWDASEMDRTVRFLTELYTALGKPEAAARWRAELDRPAVAPPPRPVGKN